MDDQRNSGSFAIWWLNPADCEAIGSDTDQQPWPSYIKTQYRGLLGRAGRGRLWVPEDIPVHEIPWDATKPLASRAEECGGIVFHAKDVPAIATLPGFVTDLELNTWQLQ